LTRRRRVTTSAGLPPGGTPGRTASGFSSCRTRRLGCGRNGVPEARRLEEGHTKAPGWNLFKTANISLDIATHERDNIRDEDAYRRKTESFPRHKTGFGPRASGLGPRASGLGPRASGLGPRASGFGLRASVPRLTQPVYNPVKFRASPPTKNDLTRPPFFGKTPPAVPSLGSSGLDGRGLFYTHKSQGGFSS